MIRYISHPATDEEIHQVLNPLVSQWFRKTFFSFSMPQKFAVLDIHQKKNVLVSAVTGSGKTLTAFTSILSELLTLDQHNLLEDRVYAVYISPLKALSNDISVNLKQPLKEMEELAKKKCNIRIGVRTGDTTPSEKSAMLRHPPHILITTPESFSLTITSARFKEHMMQLQWVIIDEIHALADNKRGVHLSLALEMLEHFSNNSPTRIGLSATAEPLEEIAQFLVGTKRNCEIANINLDKKMDMKVLCPVPDLINITHEVLHNEMYKLLDALIQEHKTTLIFTNTRSATERVVHHLKEKFPRKYTENIGAHHGSLSKDHRLKLEERMRKGNLKVIVCSTSLELGIDIGYIDLVVMLGSPKSVARATQRAGRAGHKLHDTIKARIIALDRDDLIECGILLKSVLERKIDNIHIPRNCLDVLAQQLFGIAITTRIKIQDMYKLVTKSYCYATLEFSAFMEVIEYLAGEYSKLEDRNVYAKIWYDQESGEIGRRGKLARVLYMTNLGTIPDESYIQVKVNDQVIGHIDEGFLERLKRGDVFVLGGHRYEFLYSRGMTAQVNASVMRPPTIPSWFSEMLPLSFDLATSISRFRRLANEKFEKETNKQDIITFIHEYMYVDKNSSESIYHYLQEQFLFSQIPHDKKLVIESYRENNRHYYIFHALYGRRINDVLSRAAAFILGKSSRADIELGINDNGFYLASEKSLPIESLFQHLTSKNLNIIMQQAIDQTEVLKRRFRHCATRALMILRNYRGKTKRVGRQQVSSMLLLNAVKRISSDFSILKEARREVLEDLMDIEHAHFILKQIEEGKTKIAHTSDKLPSPFAFNLVLQGHLDFMKMEDKVEFLRRMHTMVLAKIYKKIPRENI